MMTEEKICPKCGSENPEEAEYCQECHEPLIDSTTPDFIDPQQSSRDDLNLLGETEDDLPGLLHALKNEDDQSITPDEGAPEGNLESGEDEDLFELETSLEDEDVPEWLHRIRQRASEEDDSIGEITQKISAAKQSLREDGISSQQENFEAWIGKLRGQTGGIIPGESEADGGDEEETESQEEQGEKEPDWLRKIRKAQGKLDLTDEQAENGSLNWLEGLAESEEDAVKSKGESEGEGLETFVEDTDQVDLDETSVTQEIILDEDAYDVPIPPRLTITAEEQSQAQALTSMILDENAPRPIRKLKRPSKLGAARFFFALLLIISLSLSLYIVKYNVGRSPHMQPQTAGLIDWVNSLPQGVSLLVIFDYQPAYSSEINLMAKPLLADLVEREADIKILSSALSGSVLYKQLFEDLEGGAPPDIKDLGYFPIGAYGAFRLGMESAGNWKITGLPESATKLPTETFEGILILSDSYYGARSWIEQISILTPETPVNLVVTAAAAPMLAPYFDSGQLTGMAYGLNGAAVLESAFSDGDSMATRSGAYRVGLLILMSVMVIGAIYAGNQKHEEGGAA